MEVTIAFSLNKWA